MDTWRLYVDRMAILFHTCFLGDNPDTSSVCLKTKQLWALLYYQRMQNRECFLCFVCLFVCLQTVHWSALRAKDPYSYKYYQKYPTLLSLETLHMNIRTYAHSCMVQSHLSKSYMLARIIQCKYVWPHEDQGLSSVNTILTWSLS